ncbi:MAG: holo-ACP synthase [Saprospiraceae bacterium]|nr:holo-ACP synthase [Saprospiraceae bacterium]
MIIGTGIDMIETARIQAKLEKEIGLREHLFSAEEIAYCESMANRYEHYAARFAAKEALLKALGTGLSESHDLNTAEIVHQDSGKPQFRFDHHWEEYLNRMGDLRIHVTLTHIKDTACAMVVIEK